MPKTCAAGVYERLEGPLAQLRQEHNVQPTLHVILVGDDPASQVYVRSKSRKCAALQIGSEITRLPDGTTQDEIVRTIDALNQNPEVDGILVQLPIPGLETRAVLDRVDATKDVDGFHPENVGMLVQKRPRFVPCTPLGVLAMLDQYDVDLSGERALVIGRSDIVGKPMALLLTHRNATVTLAHSRTQDLEARVRESKVVVVAMGRPRAIPSNWFRDDAVVVDVGIHRMDNGKLTGDVDPEGLNEGVYAYSPVPGGVGPMTIAMLMVNTTLAAISRRGIHNVSMDGVIPSV